MGCSSNQWLKKRIAKNTKYWKSHNRIPLSRGMDCLIDPEDFEWLSHYSWCAIPGNHGAENTLYYAITNVFQGVNSRPQNIQIYMHRMIWEYHNGEIPDGYVIDHISQDSLDNRLSNLRAVTNSVNLSNSRKNVLIQHDGQTKTLSQWSRDLGVCPQTISNRYKAGLDISQLVTKGPKQPKKTLEIEYEGKVWYIIDLARHLNLNYDTMKNRLYRGCSVEEIVYPGHLSAKKAEEKDSAATQISS